MFVQVWAGPSAWPDFFNPAGVAYWATNIANFRSLVPADGLWLDMNEVQGLELGRRGALSFAYTSARGCALGGCEGGHCACIRLQVSNFCSGQCKLPSSWVVLLWRKFTRCTTCCLLDCTPPG